MKRPNALEVLTYWLPFIISQEGRDDESDLWIDRARDLVDSAAEPNPVNTGGHAAGNHPKRAPLD